VDGAERDKAASPSKNPGPHRANAAACRLLSSHSVSTPDLCASRRSRRAGACEVVPDARSRSGLWCHVAALPIAHSSAAVLCVDEAEGAAVDEAEGAAVDEAEGAAVDEAEGAAVDEAEGAAVAAARVAARRVGSAAAHWAFRLALIRWQYVLPTAMLRRLGSVFRGNGGAVCGETYILPATSG
jgi:hypothetical protein